MFTASWFQKLPPDHIKIGISRGTPRGIGAGYRVYRKLAPGPWFRSVDMFEYRRRYYDEILRPLDRKRVITELLELAGDRIPVLCCFERAGGPSWCHRALAAEWLAEGLGHSVPEYGFENVPQQGHPLLPAELRRHG
jgi:hypothetical protein